MPTRPLCKLAYKQAMSWPRCGLALTMIGWPRADSDDRSLLPAWVAAQLRLCVKLALPECTRLTSPIKSLDAAHREGLKAEFWRQDAAELIAIQS